MAVPTITSVTPNTGRTGGRQLVRIAGTNFQALPDPPPLVAGQPTPAPSPSVEVLFGTIPARDVRVMSASLLHATSPISDPGVVSITVRNVTQEGALIPGETVTLANAFTFARPNMARSVEGNDEVTLQRVTRRILEELTRQVIERVSLTTHTDFGETGAQVAALADIPGLVLAGPRCVRHRMGLNNQRRKDQSPADGAVFTLSQPENVDLEFTIVGVDNLYQPTLALMTEVIRFFTRNTTISVAKDAAAPLGEQIEYEMELVPGSFPSMVGSPNNSNIQAFSGKFRVFDVAIDDDDPRVEEGFPVLDLGLEFQQLPITADEDEE